MRLFSGQRAWVLQRLSVLLVLVLLALGGLRLLFWPAPSYEDWRAFTSSAHGAVLIALFFGAIALHAWVGARDVVLDYLHQRALRFAVLLLVATVLVAVMTRVLFALGGQIA
ncbi:MAG TPA: succinate dehydrogenase, hydrophobic membrane anchor protein [Burkholderiaceae bacterium]|nr:succinate dehydrogenase, hydrophobic membrane anchor protein [Burkholderiaceae bacterium]